ncbi:MAG: hypothetical protein GQ469_05675 [Methanosarcinales archaeon]|nr:hypothetical protein [Methanosarcinales archaeon]
MEDLLKTFTIPDNTTMEEHSIVTTGGAIIGNHTVMGFGIIANSVIAGERVRINGNVIGTEEVRIDMWSQVNGDVRTKNDAYIGEFVNINGRLIVGKDLDIGKNVKIDKGYEARGWLVVRNPIPVVIYIFLYLTELLRMGKDEEVDNALKNLFSDESDDLEEDKLLIIPSGSKIDLESIKVPDKAVIGSGCRMMGNIRASSIVMGSNNTLFGSIKTTNEIVIGEGNTIHGNLVTRGDVRINKNSHILGEINGGKVMIHEEARVDGAMRAANGVIIIRDEMEEEYKTGGLLDMVPEPAVSKETKVTPDKIKADEKVPDKTIDKATTTGSVTRMETGAPEAVSYDIPAKRMTTAVRLGDIIKPVPAKKKTITSTTADKKKTTTSTTADKEKPTTKTTADKEKPTDSTTAGKEKPTTSTTADKKKPTTSTTADKKKPTTSTTADKEKPTASTTAYKEKPTASTTAYKEKPTTSTTAYKEKPTIRTTSAEKETTTKKKTTAKKTAAKKKTTTKKAAAKEKTSAAENSTSKKTVKKKTGTKKKPAAKKKTTKKTTKES